MIKLEQNPYYSVRPLFVIFRCRLVAKWAKQFNIFFSYFYLHHQEFITRKNGPRTKRSWNKLYRQPITWMPWQPPSLRPTNYKLFRISWQSSKKKWINKDKKNLTLVWKDVDKICQLAYWNISLLWKCTRYLYIKVRVFKTRRKNIVKQMPYHLMKWPP